jgi:large subunit ribosomal protein L21
MSKSAVIETGGKQYKVKEGDEIFIELLSAEDDEKVTFNDVLAIFDNKNTKIGTPYLEGATVEASVVKSGKAKKIIVFKMKRRKGYRRKQGHRQPYTKVKIEKISA